ncbi:Uma2 family endonuclease [Streptomyces longisporoflavus]|uniref:Uma2 family endonuclease n=1 Tax=Streptomyces longisporoflavus TaxID=28044 RepID=A0ABW7QJH2_9ACTN
MDAPSAWDVLDGVNLPRGYRVEITEAKIIMAPRGEYPWKVILETAPQIDQQLAGHGAVLSDVMIDFPSSQYGYAPDLAIVAPGAERNSRGRFEWHSLEAVIEVVSRSSRDNDFAKKFRLYAECGIPLHVVIDPEDGVCTVHRGPTRSGGYADEAKIPFGQDLVLPLQGRDITITTGGFPKVGDLD